MIDHLIATFKGCAPASPLEWPLWWLRRAMLRPRLALVYVHHRGDGFQVGLASAPLMYNVFGRYFVEYVKTKVTLHQLEHQPGRLRVRGEAFDVACHAWLNSNGKL